MGESQDAVQFVVGRFNAMLAADGARLDVVSTTEHAVTLRFVAPDGTGECEACALDPDDLQRLYGDAFHAYWDASAFDEIRERERGQRHRLLALAEGFGESEEGS